MSPRSFVSLGAALLSLATAVYAEPGGDDSDRRQIEAAAKTLGIKPDDLRSSPIAGLYEVSLKGTTGYVTTDGRYFVKGEIYEIATRINVTEQHRQEERRAALAALDEKEMIIFSPEQPKYTVTVFTDVDCTYCRKMHSEIKQLNEAGVRVRYVAFPRGGPNTESWTKMESVWCAKDPRDALTRAKRGEEIKSGSACTHAKDIDSQYQLGISLGVSGTPGVFAEDGRLVGGYVSPQQLVTRLDEHKNTIAAGQ
jgi:thiol:disulfide interchange protein DsbC